MGIVFRHALSIFGETSFLVARVLQRVDEFVSGWCVVHLKHPMIGMKFSSLGRIKRCSSWECKELASCYHQVLFTTFSRKITLFM